MRKDDWDIENVRAWHHDFKKNLNNMHEFSHAINILAVHASNETCEVIIPILHAKQFEAARGAFSIAEECLYEILDQAHKKNERNKKRKKK